MTATETRASYYTASGQRMLLTEMNFPQLRSHCKYKQVISRSNMKMLVSGLILFHLNSFTFPVYYMQ